MSKLPILSKNAFLSLVIIDNGIWAHLAYTDYDANREYILSDFTDLNPLRQRLDDEFFNKNFWYEYFDNLEKVFSWNIVDKNIFELMTFRKFADQGDGISGIRILVDENQEFFNKIFTSLRSFSNDITLRIIDDGYVYNLVEGLATRLGYDDLLFVEMDLLDFKIYRAKKTISTKGGIESFVVTKSKMSWNNDFGVIDSIKDSRFRAFLSSDIPQKELLDYWSNFVLNRVFFSEDPNMLDLLRSYCTIQCHSMYQDGMEKLEKFGSTPNSAIITSGLLPLLLGNQKTLLSIIDGLELEGKFDYFFDNERVLLSYGKSYINSPASTDIVLTRKNILSKATKVLIPDLHRVSGKNKIILGGYTDSLSIGKGEFFAISPEFTYIELPKSRDKLVVEAEFKNGAYMRNTENEKEISFVSTPEKQAYDSILIDGRPKPVIYGPDVYSNRIKLQMWINDFKT